MNTSNWLSVLTLVSPIVVALIVGGSYVRSRLERHDLRIDEHERQLREHSARMDSHQTQISAVDYTLAKLVEGVEWIKEGIKELKGNRS